MAMKGYTWLLLLMISETQLLMCFGRSIPAGLATAKYAIVFDAGSSKTKLQIFKIDMNSPPLDVADIEELDPTPERVTPGIARLAGNPSKVESYMMPLLTAARDIIPQEAQESTQVYFFATAGMRLLLPKQRRAIIAKVKELLKDKSKCPFEFYSKNAQVISGEFEGIYAWITVNFLKGNFVPGIPKQTSGILDLGGASHQNAFNNPTNETISLTLGGREFHLFARTYLGYGMDEAHRRYLRVISQEQASNVLKSPCHHKGFKVNVTIGGEIVEVVGTAVVSQCRSIIKKTFFCKREGCPFYDQPRLRGDFVGFSGIYYTALGTGLLCYSCTKQLSPAMYEKGSRQFCAKPYQAVSSDPYAKVNCFRGNFVYELLAQGYNLPSTKTIEVGKKIGGFNLGWSLGAMLYNGKYL
ncbi:ectonucleoside triphosphate diphosphohydrolase 1-like [Acropora palmata]|uniref:ectonucleoside triphosphate diphosphohydrolase 1-like n=1 Tax=Acropora palmata TaxID=6131 RepID=UPI003DA185C1